MAANAIRHPNIVEVTDMGRFDDGAVFMVLEYLEGRELTDVLTDEGALPLGRVVHIASQICSALGAAHEQGIVHRDLKPDNVYLCPREDDPDFVKVLDFGIAKFKEAGGRGVTRTGMTIGTPHYMAPEQASASKDLDHRADIYSLGVILFHAISGVLPFDDESFPLLMVKVVTHPPPRLSSLVPDLPADVDALVQRMLAKDPSERPQSCAEVRGALAPFRADPTAYRASAPPTTEPAGGSGTAPTAAMGSVSSVTSAASGGSGPGHSASGPQGALPASGPRPIVDTGAAPVPERTGRGGALALAAAVAALLVALIGGGALYWATRPPEEDAPPPPAPRGPTPAATEAPAEPAAPEGGEDDADGASAPPTEAPAGDAPRGDDVATVRVQIQVRPRRAELFLDGDRIANPFDADLPQTDEPRRLEARLEGYRTVVQDLVLRFPQRVNLELERGRGVDDRRRAARRPRRADSARRRAEEAGTPPRAEDEQADAQETAPREGTGGAAAEETEAAAEETAAERRDDGFLDVDGRF
jgi:serine/threonine-protein kinase